jgi:hypothetical protein
MHVVPLGGGGGCGDVVGCGRHYMPCASCNAQADAHASGVHASGGHRPATHRRASTSPERHRGSTLSSSAKVVVGAAARGSADSSRGRFAASASNGRSSTPKVDPATERMNALRQRYRSDARQSKRQTVADAPPDTVAVADAEIPMHLNKINRLVRSLQVLQSRPHANTPSPPHSCPAGLIHLFEMLLTVCESAACVSCA